MLTIDAALEKNFIRRARYLAETIIRDYGTHVLTQVEAGAKIEEVDYVNSSIINTQDNSLTDLRLLISAGFLQNTIGISVNGSFVKDKKLNETLSQATRYSVINTYGGPEINDLLAQGFQKDGERVTGCLVLGF